MPVNWLKLMSFVVRRRGRGASPGTLFAALNASVFPLTFYFVLLITVYTMVILGGSGSQAGRRARRDHHQRRCSSCCATRASRGSSSSLALVGGAGRSRSASRRSSRIVARRDARLRLRRARACACASTQSWVAGEQAGGFAGALAHWVVVPAHLARWVAPVSYVGADRASSLVLTLARGRAAPRPAACRRSTSRRSSGRT